MINTKNVRQKFLKILSEIKNISNADVRNKIIKNLINLKDFIKDEYNYDNEIPVLSHNFISDILTDIDILDSAIENYRVSIEYELPDDEEKDLKYIKSLSNNYTDKYTFEQTPVLKGQISKYKYIWHSEPNACQVCEDLNNTKYDNKSDIPDKPHPNCKCSVKEIKNNDRCDCLDDLFKQIDDLIRQAEDLFEKIDEAINECSNLLEKVHNTWARNVLENCIDALQQIFGTVLDFLRNYNDMKDANTKYADKYFHSKANCDGAKRGELGAIVAKMICDVREFTDLFNNVLRKKMTIEASLKDSAEDQEANHYGREQGRKYPNQDSRESVKIYRPNGLPERY